MRYQLNIPGVLREPFEGEEVIINLDTGVYFVLNAVGSVIFEMLQSTLSRPKILSYCKEHFGKLGDKEQSEINAITEELIVEGIIVPLTELEKKEPTTDEIQHLLSIKETAYQTPELHRFTDMQELLLLDPVHEVDDRGWPYASKDLDSVDS